MKTNLVKKNQKTYKLASLVVITTQLVTSCAPKLPTESISSLSSPQVTASAKELVRITDDVVAEFQPCLSQDGKQLLYVIRDDAQSLNEKWSIRLKKEVLMPGFTPLIGKRTSAPSWINNQGDFIFTYYATNPVIATSNISRLGITYVGQNAYGDYDNNAQVSPDGKKVVLTTSLQGGRSICLVNRDGTSFTALSDGIEPKWHPDGKKILYNKLSGNYFQLFELNLETYQSTQITSGESNSYGGNYSPDGKHIVFVSSKDDKFGHLFIMRTNGQKLTQLTSGDSNEVQPFWGTDGSIYFASTAGAKRPENKKKTNAFTGLGSSLYFNSVNLLRNNSLEREMLSTSFLYSDIWKVKPLLVD